MPAPASLRWRTALLALALVQTLAAAAQSPAAAVPPPDQPPFPSASAQAAPAERPPPPVDVAVLIVAQGSPAEQAVERARAGGSDPALAAALLALANDHLRQSRPAKAMPVLEEALALANKIPDFRVGREAARAAAQASDAMDDPDMARTWRDQAEAYRERIAAEFVLPPAPLPMPPRVPVGGPVAAPALPAPATPEHPATPLGLPFWMFAALPLSLLLGWAWIQSHDRNERLREKAERLDRHKRHLRSANTALQEKTEQLRQAAATDALTGCLARQAFAEQMLEELKHASHYGQPVALLVFDLDHFKLVNDNHGHLSGDSALRVVAGIVRDSLRGDDLLGRFGGDEFLIGCRDLDRDAAFALAERIRIATRAHAGEADPVLSLLSLSIGVAHADPAAGYGIDSLFARADRALYQAKRGGRNRSVMDDAGSPPPPEPQHIPRSLTTG